MIIEHELETEADESQDDPPPERRLRDNLIGQAARRLQAEYYDYYYGEAEPDVENDEEYDYCLVRELGEPYLKFKRKN